MTQENKAAENDKDVLEDVQEVETEAAPSQKFLCITVDIIFDIGLLVLFYRFAPQQFLQVVYETPLLKYVVLVAIVLLYRCTCLIFWNKTIGMKIFRLKYLNEKLQPLSTAEKVKATFITTASSIKYYKDSD